MAIGGRRNAERPAGELLSHDGSAWTSPCRMTRAGCPVGARATPPSSPTTAFDAPHHGRAVLSPSGLRTGDVPPRAAERAACRPRTSSPTPCAPARPARPAGGPRRPAQRSTPGSYARRAGCAFPSRGSDAAAGSALRRPGQSSPQGVVRLGPVARGGRSMSLGGKPLTRHEPKWATGSFAGASRAPDLGLVLARAPDCPAK